MTSLAKELLKVVDKPSKRQAKKNDFSISSNVDNNNRNQQKELQDAIQRNIPKIKIVGCGGAGSNTITRCVEEGIRGAKMYAINTDAQHLLTVSAPVKILIGQHRTQGLGAGAKPTMGEYAAKENEEEIRRALMNTDLVFITAGMGGGTGTGSAPVVAKIAKEMGALTLAIVTTPFPGEGIVRMQNARWGVRKLEEETDTVIIIENNKLLKLVPKLPLNQAFRVADEVLMNSIKGITDMVNNVGLVNLDFNDLQTVMKRSGTAVISMGEAKDSPNKAREAVSDALDSPLLDVDISEVTGALVCVFGGRDMTVKEAQKVAQEINDRIGDSADLIWGAYIDDKFDNQIRVMIVLKGVKLKNVVSEDSQGFGKGISEDLDFIK